MPGMWKKRLRQGVCMSTLRNAGIRDNKIASCLLHGMWLTASERRRFLH